MAADQLACVVAKVEAIGPASFLMDLHLLENRFEFARALRVPESVPPPATPPRPAPRSPEPMTTEPTLVDPNRQ